MVNKMPSLITVIVHELMRYLIVLFHSAFLVRLTENVTMALAANGKLCVLLTWIQEEMQ